jgi:quercetin 2,3-dioxygenase
MSTTVSLLSSRALLDQLLTLIILISTTIAFAIPTLSQSATNKLKLSQISTNNCQSSITSEGVKAVNTCTATGESSIPKIMSSTTKLRTINKILPRPPTHMVGDGFKVYPVFDKYAFTELLSPLLMFDYGAPTNYPARPGKKPLGVGQHPHRGFETVTVSFTGEVEHSDSTGNTDVIKDGDVQWMTAGRGIIHQEYHSKQFTQTGGVMEMCQLWVNLPKKYKMTKPGYQAITKDAIPTVNLPLGTDDKDKSNVIGTARIIAGELSTTKGAASTFSPVQVWDVSVPKSGTVIDLPFPSNQNLILFVRRGTIEIISSNDESNNKKLSPQDVAVMTLDNTSDTFRFRTFENETSVLVLGGEPLNEPIAARGPFVMNTDAELQQAWNDYQNGRMGQ